MADEATTTGTVGTGSEGTGEPGGSTDPNEAGNQNPPAGNGDGGVGEGKNDIASLPDWAQTYVKELRGEAAANRVKAQEKAAAAAEEARLAAMSDVDKAVEEAVNKRTEELTTTFTKRLVEGAVRAALTEKGVTQTAAALKALRDDEGNIPDVTLDDDGNVKGLTEVVNKFVTDFPGFVEKNPTPSRRETGNPGDRGGSTPKKDANSAIRDAFRGRSRS